MSLYEYFWKIFLRPIPFEKEGDRYIAEVHTIKKPVDTTDLVRQIMSEGTENEYETILSIINRYEDQILKNVCAGRRVQTPNCLITPRVNGVWPTAATRFNPDVHQRTVNITPSLRMRRILEKIGVELLGEKKSDAYISRVTDEATGLRDNTITAGDTISLEGRNIKVTSEEDDSGIFFLHPDGTATPVTRRLTANEPSRLIVHVPAQLQPGSYQLQIRTHYTKGGNKRCKMLKTITYPHLLTVR